MRLLRNPAFLAVSLGHFAVDVLNGQFGVLLAALSGTLGLTNAAIGLIATCYQFFGAATQPLFGWLSDRHGPRWAIAGGVLWMAFFFALFAVAPGYWVIACLLLGTIGSAAFHPPGTHKAAQAGQVHMAGQAATAASLFFLFGQGGLSVGPAIGGFLLDHLDRMGVLIIAILVAPIGIFAAWVLRSPSPSAASPAPAPRAEAATQRTQPQVALFILVLILAGLRVWTQATMTTFMPKYLHDQGVSATEYGLVVALFMGGSAIGGVVAAMLADRWGKVRVVTLSFALSIAPLYILPITSGLLLYLVAAAAGFVNGAPHSILVTIAQKALPGRGSLASGLALGFMFTAGALGSYVTGLAADHYGLLLALQLSSVLAVISTTTSVLLRFEKRPSLSPLPTGD